MVAVGVNMARLCARGHVRSDTSFLCSTLLHSSAGFRDTVAAVSGWASLYYIMHVEIRDI